MYTTKNHNKSLNSASKFERQLLRFGRRAEPGRPRESPEGHEETAAVRRHLPALAEAARDGRPQERDSNGRLEPGQPGSVVRTYGCTGKGR